MPLSPVRPTIAWNAFTEPRPYPAVIGFAYDRSGRFPLLFRSAKVRSARLAWSLPSGLHEVGFTRAQQFANEIHEEFNLEADPETCEHIGVYEPILPEDNWHWIMHVLTMRVKTLDTFTNREPDKHSDTKIVSVYEFPVVLRELKWTSGLEEAMTRLFPGIYAAITQGIKE